MANTYSPRRQSKRWLDGDCPRDVLAIYNDPRTFDQYTVFYATPVIAGDFGKTIIAYRAMSVNPFAAQGFGQSGELSAYQTANYRYVNRNRACKWSDLPPNCQALVRQDCKESSHA